MRRLCLSVTAVTTAYLLILSAYTAIQDRPGVSIVDWVLAIVVGTIFLRVADDA